jgi:diguanylate cyclase (GGDEF)-like protein
MSSGSPHVDPGIDPAVLAARLMEAVEARVFVCDVRPARARAQEMAGSTAELGRRLSESPAEAVALYRLMEPTSWSSSAAAFYGLPDRHPADALDGMPDELLQQAADAVLRIVSGEETGVFEVHAHAGDGRLLASRFSWAAIGPADDPFARVLMTSLDRNALVTAQEEAARRRDQVRLALEGSSTAVYMFDADLRVVWVDNPRTRSDFDFTGLDLEQCFGAGPAVALTAAFRPVLEEGINAALEVTLERDGVAHVFDFTAKPWRDRNGRIVGLVGTNTEVTERAAMVRDLEQAAVTDGLTGLVNRQGLAHALTAIRSEGGDGDAACLLAFDVPSFHAVNDVYGHDAGDDCLRALADILREEAGQRGLAARLAGDQFVLVIRGERVARAHSEALRIADRLEGIRVATPAGPEIALQVVVGIASADGLASGRRSPSEILGDVDIALSRAKRTRSTVSLIEEDAARHREAVRRRMEWGQRIRVAIDADALQVVAQPIIDLRTGRARAFELLVRLEHEGRLIPAGAFMPDIELLGMTALVDRWMVRRAMRILSECADVLDDRHLAVNVSATTFADGDFLALIDAAAREFGSDVTRLAVEMTETQAVADIPHARAVVEGLRERGILFVLDDFGSGLAAPDYLRDLTADWLKIDGRFVRGASSSTVDRAIVAGALTMARAMDIPVVVEWVEDEETRVLMSEMGAHLGQGFHLGEPGHIPEVLALA